MLKAPLASTIIAISLIPIALLFIHAFISGIKKLKYHSLTGALAIIFDLAMSLGYMTYRSLGGKASGSALHFTPSLITYFIIHGIVSLIVIALEISTLITALPYFRNKFSSSLHRKFGKILFPIWFLAFLTGELFYVVTYIL